MDGLSDLASVGSYLYISDNDVLANLDGLAALTSVGGDLTLDGNPSLCEGSIAVLLARLESFGYTGTLTDNDNDPGC